LNVSPWSTAEARRPSEGRAPDTYLVLYVSLGELDRLLEDAILLLELDRLHPVIEGAGDVDLVSRMLPGVV
jgi:hypothetical protein